MLIATSAFVVCSIAAFPPKVFQPKVWASEWDMRKQNQGKSKEGITKFDINMDEGRGFHRLSHHWL